MSCCDEQGHHKKDDKNCVADILRQIVDAQDDIVDDDCDIGCEQSIQDLRGDTTAPNNLDTVPVLLYCKCEPFRGFGVRNDQNHTVLDSFFFRVNDVGRDNCATLELLRDPSDTQPGCVDPTKQKTGNLRSTGICITVDLDCFCHVTCLPAMNTLG
ncbi:CotY/CotZ family spore coat protein [Alkalibacillus almallahensis]|uniref:CotY/CotZ family spore coat protein n=1 Tax=Alkalibacillus almallahensis TaxID=1379154 RepID=UPI001421EB8D|nr:CotY/CotZ family spore coat protein [Alkalibacillus almallahensis]NIK13225.1 spore coat protein Z [Alkalibacillus almallahensis]